MLLSSLSHVPKRWPLSSKDVWACVEERDNDITTSAGNMVGQISTVNPDGGPPIKIYTQYARAFDPGPFTAATMWSIARGCLLCKDQC